MREAMDPNVYLGLDNMPGRPAGCVVTIGNFDGVHRGHQALLRLASELADRESIPAVAVTFEPPPARLIAPDKAPQPIMQLDQRCRTLLDAGADEVVILETDRSLLQMSPERFVHEVLMARFRPRHVVEGRNFFFGHKRSGDVETLAAFGRELGFEVHVVPPVMVDLTEESGVTVSSSLTRRLIAEGRVADAFACLGRPHTMIGAVITGQGQGRYLRFPTANLDCGLQLTPADGVYAGRAEWDGRRGLAAVSVGCRPTFGEQPRAIEVHLLDPPGDLYGRTMAVEFHRFLRPQQRFDSREELTRQIAEDVQHVRDQLG